MDDEQTTDYSEYEEQEDKVIIFHGFTDDQVQEIVNSYTASDFPFAYMAVTTPQSRIKRLRDVIWDIIKQGREAGDGEEEYEEDDQ